MNLSVVPKRARTGSGRLPPRACGSYPRQPVVCFSLVVLLSGGLTCIMSSIPRVSLAEDNILEQSTWLISVPYEYEFNSIVQLHIVGFPR